jgi:hypothetical protein
MNRMVDAAAEPLRLAVAVILGGTSVFLILSVLTTTTGAPSAVVLTAVAATVAALAGRTLSVSTVHSPPGLSLRKSIELPALRSGRVTDSPRQPLRPRAPGLD